ncbi:protein-histidine N-methyltransferase [Aspergillus undulatus]|uniref:protein-histidine N-methyltransferase n=1 Tax=Aspergillus undulatus TaxID=1810928 RepID=UPI003CCDC24A
MASGFSFGFSGDDIDIDETEINNIDENNVQETNPASNLPELIKAQKHEMSEWLSTLPSQISYNKCTIAPSPSQGEGGKGKALTVARRDVFDIRAQLMVEDSAEEQNGELIAGLEKGDITPKFYEGGFKTWECSIDLAGLAAAGEGVGVEVEGGHVVELGAGTAVPSLALFVQLLSQSDTETSAEKKRTHFTFADYNSAVLRLVTLPNILLTWHHFVTDQKPTDTQADGEDQAEEKDEAELDITPDLLDSFQQDLAHRGISLNFISGAWSPSFVDLVLSSPEVASLRMLVLASETIYSPASLGAFSKTLLALLSRSSGDSQALIAAKKVYFGVGGGVDEFLSVLREISVSGLVVEERVDIKTEGVGRIILEIRFNQ